MRRPMKSLQRPMTGPAMAPARKNMDWTGAALSALRPKEAAICGSAGVTMLALSWKDSTPSSSVEISRAARRPPIFGLASSDGGPAAKRRLRLGCSHQTPLFCRAGPALGM